MAKAIDIPISKKLMITVDQAALLTGIGRDKLYEITSRENIDFVLWVGSKRLLKREKLENFLLESVSL